MELETARLRLRPFVFSDGNGLSAIVGMRRPCATPSP